MQLLFVLVLISAKVGAENYEEYSEYQEYDQNQDLLSEIFQQSIELHKTENDNSLEENVRKKRLQITPYSEQGNHFPVFDFDTKPKAKRTTAAPEITTASSTTELPAIKKFSFKKKQTNP